MFIYKNTVLKQQRCYKRTLLTKIYRPDILKQADERWRNMLEHRLQEWMDKVIAAHNGGGMVDTVKMILDVDKIIAEEFGHDYFFEENR